MDQGEFDLYQEDKFKQYEALCKKCGACCGIFDGDPCSHLIAKDNNTYICGAYENRFGLRLTKKGKIFKCVPIRNILFKSWAGSWNCAYKKFI